MGLVEFLHFIMIFIKLVLKRNVEPSISFKSSGTSKALWNCLIKTKVHTNQKGYHFVIYT